MKWTTLLILAIAITFSGCSKGHKVVEIVDGDTIIVKPRLQVRIIGIDAPENDVDSQKFKDDLVKYETSQEQEAKVAKESKEELQALLLNKNVTLKYANDIDYEVLANGRTGRALRYVYLSNKDVGKLMLQKRLARTWKDTSNVNG